jgi:hypothetical protein
MVTITFGPRYRWHADHRISIYGQGLVGEANGLRTSSLSAFGADSSANSLVLKVGGVST